MRQTRPLLPIRPLVLPARLGRRQRWDSSSASAAEVRARFEQSNLAVAMASRPLWLRGPLFQSSTSSSEVVRHAA